MSVESEVQYLALRKFFRNSFSTIFRAFIELFALVFIVFLFALITMGWALNSKGVAEEGYRKCLTKPHTETSCNHFLNG